MLPIFHILLPDVHIPSVLHNATLLDLHEFAYLHMNTPIVFKTSFVQVLYQGSRCIISLRANPRVVLPILSAVHDGGGAASFDRSSFLFSMEGPRGNKN